MELSGIRGIQFDFDGTLFDSMYVWETVGADYLRSRGVVPTPDLRERYRTMSLEQVAVMFRDEFGVSGTVESICAGVNALVEDGYFHHVLPKPGVTALLERLRGRGLGLCVVTATDEYLVSAALRRCGLEGYFAGIFTCAGVGCPKDDPHIYRVAAEAMGLACGEMALMDDALYALRAAKAAGLTLIGVPDDSQRAYAQGVREIADIFLEDYRTLG